jgi:hypothetical protein
MQKITILLLVAFLMPHPAAHAMHTLAKNKDNIKIHFSTGTVPESGEKYIEYHAVKKNGQSIQAWRYCETKRYECLHKMGSATKGFFFIQHTTNQRYCFKQLKQESTT